jgi:hypothetical protein
MAQTSGEYVPVPVESDPWSQSFAAPVQTMEHSSRDGEIFFGCNCRWTRAASMEPRIWKTGTSKAGKPWGHWKCVAAITRDMPGVDKYHAILFGTTLIKPQVLGSRR